MRLAVYCDLRYQRRSGALYCEESFARFAAALRDWSDELVLVGRGADASDPAFRHRLRDDVDFLALPGYPSLSRLGSLARALPASLLPLWRMLGGVDAVWVLGPHPVGVACVALAALRRRRVVLGVRENLRAYVGRRHPGRSERSVAWALDVVWRALARVVPVVVVGDELGARYRRARMVVPIAVSLVGADELIDMTSALGRDYEGERRLLAVGRLDPEKNPLLLADVLARLRWRDPAWRLVVCGEGPLSGELERRLEDLGVGREAELLGVVGSEELRARYESSHALLHVSWTEGVPQVLFEAWAAGLPVVATDVGGVAGIARPAALLIPPGDAEAAALALERIAGDAALRHDLIAAGFECVSRHTPAVECRRVAALLEGGIVIKARRSNPYPPPGHRHMWFWTVLGPDDRRVAVIGDPDLGEIVAESGFELVDGSVTPPDAVLIGAGGRAGRRAARGAAAGLRDDGVVAIPVGGGPAAVPADQSRAGRALELLAEPLRGLVAGGRGARLGRMLRRRRLVVDMLATGARARPYGIGPGVVRHRRRIPVGVVVSGSRSPARPSVADLAVERTADAVGAPLKRTSTAVLESGKLLTELVDPAGRRYILRLAGGPARPPLESALRCLTELASADPPPAVRGRIPWPLAEGEVGLARYVLERKGPGAHPRRMTAQLWRECVEFLVELHLLGREPGGRDGGHPAIADRAETVGAHVDRARRGVLERIVERLRADLAAVPLGWAHGDFWNENLLTRRGHLELVVDWDWAAPRSLPLLDLLDLTALGQRRGRDLRHGPRFLRMLWPLALARGDERVHRYCDATGTPADVRTLEALTVAYWLDRVSRDLRPFDDSPRRPGWLAENVEAPLGALEQGRLVTRKGTRPVLVLCYHAVSEDWPSELAVTPGRLRHQLELLVRRGYTGATFSNALDAPASRRTLAVTFDDAYRSTLTHAYPVLAELGLPGTVFVPTDFAGRPGPMSWPGIHHWLGSPHEEELRCLDWDELRGLSDLGWEVGSHTRSHPRLPDLDDELVMAELEGSRAAIEAALDEPCRALAYPYGAADARVVECARAAGYGAAGLLDLEPPVPEPLAWPRVGVYREDTAWRYRAKLSPRLRRLATALRRIAR